MAELGSEILSQEGKVVNMFDVIQSDYRRSTNKEWSVMNYIFLCFSSKGVAAVKDYRLSNWFYKKGMRITAKIIQNRNIKKHGCDIGFQAEIGSGFAIGHSVGVVITGDAIIGKNCTIMSGVTIGAKKGKNEGAPIIGENVYIGTGAKIVGKCVVGNDVIIGANAVVIKDIKANSIAVGIPAEEKIY